ncbi:MAG: tetraacyldisaccharide 4'-kinase [Gammaproteobacteria bacterium]|nr:MAG: tetraacyldisaccharide 4'-kinase [Gammaproteobacteria bacterium]
MPTSKPGWQDKLLAAWYRGAWWLILLYPVSLLFRFVAAVRKWLYQTGLKTSWRAPVPVVIVGNITLGGTGKTPVIISLVQALQAAGKNVAVISRGYGAAGPFPHRVTADSRAEQCGDEPLLIYQRTGCVVVAGPKRRLSIEMALREQPIDIVLCDDGLQHYALARDYEIAVLDAARGVGNGWCLPAGPLREPPSRLQSVDTVLYRGGSAADTAVTYQFGALVNLKTGEQRAFSPASLGESVYALAGIGQPQQFFDALLAQGFRPEPHIFADHHRFTARDLQALGDKPLIMTEKDAVKCRSFASDKHWFLPISATLPDGLAEALIALCEREL